ncbi:MAG: carboxypeptidase-like regulatory domain-containing protein [Methanoregula sp.]|jgi:hypothetical protein
MMLNKTGIVFFLTLMFVAGIIVPVVSATEPVGINETANSGKNITLNITIPAEGGVIYNDIGGSPDTIFVDVDSPYGIREVSITNGIDQSLCKKNIDHAYFCKNLADQGKNSIKVTAIDNSGHIAIETRNYFNVAGPPGPVSVLVHGNVIDEKGQPVPDASVQFESSLSLGAVQNLTGKDGSYWINAIEYPQNITVKKTGYILINKKVVLNPGLNELNFELVPSSTQLQTIPMISFDGLSEPSSAQYNATELNIPSSIKKYELLTFDIPKMRKMLANNETITVRIRGMPYKMNLHDSMGDAIGLDPAIHSYRGILENVNNSEIALTITDQVVGGRIMLGGVNYFIEVSRKKENENHIDYVYSSLDVVPYDCNGCLENDYLSHVDVPPTITGEPPTTQKASLPTIFPFGALCVISLVIWIRR